MAFFVCDTIGDGSLENPHRPSICRNIFTDHFVQRKRYGDKWLVECNLPETKADVRVEEENLEKINTKLGTTFKRGQDIVEEIKKL